MIKTNADFACHLYLNQSATKTKEWTKREKKRKGYKFKDQCME